MKYGCTILYGRIIKTTFGYGFAVLTMATWCCTPGLNLLSKEMK